MGEDVGGEEAQGAVGHSGGADLGWSHPPQPGMSLPSVPSSASAGGLPDVSSSTPPPSVPSVPHSLPQVCWFKAVRQQILFSCCGSDGTLNFFTDAGV